MKHRIMELANEENIAMELFFFSSLVDYIFIWLHEHILYEKFES